MTNDEPQPDMFGHDDADRDPADMSLRRLLAKLDGTAGAVLAELEEIEGDLWDELAEVLDDLQRIISERQEEEGWI